MIVGSIKERMLGFVIMGSVRGRREEVVFVMVGSVRGSSEAQMGLAVWVEGREVRLGLRENEENKKTKKRQRSRHGRRENQEKKMREKKDIGLEKMERVRGKVKRGHTCFIKLVFFF